MEDPSKYHYIIVVSAVIFNTDKTKILLAKRSMTETVLPGLWGIPGGKVENKVSCSEFLESEVQREVREEVGIEIKDIKLLENHLQQNTNKIHVCFTAILASGTPKALEDTDRVEWLTLPEIEKLELTPKTLDRIKLALNKI